jgi:hypothetical protein
MVCTGRLAFPHWCASLLYMISDLQKELVYGPYTLIIVGDIDLEMVKTWAIQMKSLKI